MRSTRSLGRLALAATLLGSLAVVPSPALAANPEGAIDTSYGTGGVSTALMGGARLKQTLFLPDGRIIVAGDNPTAVRYTAAGAVDTTFGTAGTATLPGDSVFAIALAGDGRIVVGGIVGIDAFVARLLPDGAPDPSFSGDGIATIPAPSLTGYRDTEDLAVDAEGRVIASGAGYDGTNDLGWVARLTASGAPDTTFSGDGVVDDYGVANSWIQRIVVQPDGAVVAAGITYTDSASRQARLVRYKADGTPDASYAGGGENFSTNSSGPLVNDLVLDANGGAILVIDDVTTLMVTRRTPTGDLDIDYGIDGFTISPDQGSESPKLASAVVAANGRLDIAMWFQAVPVVWRLLPNGAFDPSFADAGVLTPGGLGSVAPTGIDIDGAGRIRVTAPHYNGSAYDLQVLRVIGDATKPFGARVYPGSTFATSSRSVRWTASDDNTGIRDFDVRYRTASATSSTLGSATTWKSNTTATSATLGVSAGKTYCVQARADDNAGNTSAYSPQACIAFPLDDRSLTRGGSWTSVAQSSSYKGTLSRSTSLNATLKKTGVQYRKLAVVATTCSGCGKVAVYLGSTKLATLDLNSSTTKRRVVFLVDTSAALKSGTVTIKQVSSGKPVFIDGLGVSLF